jgi:hypothetical protein
MNRRTILKFVLISYVPLFVWLLICDCAISLWHDKPLWRWTHSWVDLGSFLLTPITSSIAMLWVSTWQDKLQQRVETWVANWQWPKKYN